MASEGKAHLLGAALGWLNGAQIVAPFLLLAMAERMQRRAWPFLIFGPLLLASFLGLMILPSNNAIIFCAAHGRFHHRDHADRGFGFAAAAQQAAPICRARRPACSPSAIACAIIIPTISGALWDATGKAWTAFVPLCVCAVVLTVLGVVVTRRRPASRNSARSLTEPWYIAATERH